MSGSLQVKNNKYFIVLSYKELGKWKQKWIATGLDVKGNKRAAEKLLQQEMQKLERAGYVSKTDISFADYIRYWLSIKQNQVDIVTYKGYELTANNNIIPFFEGKKIKLQDIDKKILQEYFDNTILNGRKDGKGSLSANSIKHFKTIINQVLNLAVREEKLPSNPCQYVELPKIPRFESSYYNTEQLKALFDVVSGNVLEPLIKITALYGLRRSEVLGIKWDSIDFESKRLTIKHTVVGYGERIEKDSTKTNSSRRSFVLTEEALDIFQRLKEEETNNKVLFGSSYILNDYVFKWDSGKPFEPDYITKHFKKILKDNNLPSIRFHELRHSCASLLLSNGSTLKDVQEYMGHANIKMTADIYGHLDIERKDVLASTLSAQLF